MINNTDTKEERIGLLGKSKRIWFIYKEVAKLALKAKPMHLFIVGFISILTALIAIPLLYIEKLILDKIVESVGDPMWQNAVLVIGGLIALRISLQLFNNVLRKVSFYFRRILSDYLSTDIELEVGLKLSQIDMEIIDSPLFKDRYENVKRSTQRIWNMMYSFFNIPNSLVGFFSMIGILFVLSPLIALGVILVSVPQFFIDSKITKRRYKNDKETAPMYRIKGWFISYLNPSDNYLELKLLDLTEHLRKSYREIDLRIIRRDLKIIKNSDTLNTLSQIPAYLLEFVVSIGLIISVVLENITIGSFQLYIRTLSRARSELESLLYSFVRIYEDYIYISDLVWFLNLESKIEGKEGGKIFKGGVNIEFKNVWFKYKSGQPWIIKDISFSISSKENIAIVGVNGTGKSTLIKLLARFYDPHKGVILVNGVNLKELNIKMWRKKLAVLLQEFESYPFTAQDSIGYGDVDRLDRISEIKESAKLTQVHDFIQELPLKYKNPLSTAFDKGITPSTGQKQRIGISRILFRKNAEVIIMDEPTSSVDPEAEEKIFKELAKEAKNKILIFVTQRFSTVRHADRIFLIKDGQIKERGTHKELIKLDGRYAKLFNLQAKGYK